MTLGLGLEAKGTEDVIWGLIVLKALKRGKAYEISNILLLELEKDIKEKKET